MSKVDFTLVAVPVLGSQGRRYYVEITGGIPTSCTCPDYEHRRIHDNTMCKHMRVRSGSKAYGLTRCLQCGSWLSPEELATQPEPSSSDSIQDREFVRLCGLCLP